MWHEYHTPPPPPASLHRTRCLYQVRELMNDFANSRYQSCLGYLANLKGDLQLDLHLHTHLDRLYKMVEDKCLMQ